MRIRKDSWYLIIQIKCSKIDRSITRYRKYFFWKIKQNTKTQTIEETRKLKDKYWRSHICLIKIV